MSIEKERVNLRNQEEDAPVKNEEKGSLDGRIQ